MDIVVAWDAVTGKTYNVMGNTNLNALWQTITTISATNSTPAIELQSDNPALFFRIDLEP